MQVAVQNNAPVQQELHSLGGLILTNKPLLQKGDGSINT